MKAKMVIISVVVSASLVAGIGYGAYYAMKGKAEPVEVVPVANVNTYYGWGGEEGSIYGSITSQVAQTVMLNEEYPIEDIYVKEGDQVTEGTPLFSYDMTLPELELEMAQLNLQARELTMVRLEKDLEKLKNTRATASLSSNAAVLTTAAEIEEIIEEPGDAPEPESSTPESEAAAENVPADPNGNGGSENTPTEGQTAETGAASDGISVEQVEQVQNPGQDTAQDEERLAISSSVASYEQLMVTIDLLFHTYGDSIEARDLRQAMTDIVAYYRKNLADEHSSEEVKEDGTAVTVYSYTVKQSVKDAIGEEETAKLEQFAEKMDFYHAKYTELLIAELDPENPGEFAALTEEARAEYENLAGAVRDEVENLDRLAEMEEKVSSVNQPAETDGETETETGTEATETQTGLSTEDETDDIVAFSEETETGSGTESQTETDPAPEAQTESETETETETESESEAMSAEQLQSGINSFIALAEAALGADGVPPETYHAVDLETALLFYQSNLAEERDDILDGQETALEDYVLKQAYAAYLASQEESYEVSYIEGRYKTLCMMWVKTLIGDLDPQNLTRAGFEQAKKAYLQLGDNWRAELDESVIKAAQLPAEPEDGAVSENGQSTPVQTEAADGMNGAENGMEEGGEASSEAGTEAKEEQTQSAAPAVLTYGELLDAYEMILRIQEIDPAKPAEILTAELTKLRDAYLALNDGQQAVVWNSSVLIDLLVQYGLWETEPAVQPSFPNFGGGGDDFGDFEEGYTAAELKELIEEKEREIKSCSLDIREADLELGRQQRIVDGKVVKSTMDGTVVSIGSKDGTSEDNYFVKVVNETGLFAKGAMNELALQRIKVGDEISGQTDDGVPFNAVIKEISKYPDAGGGYYSMGGMENTNASYYPFYALLDDTEEISEGGATIQLSGEMTDGENAIYLENYFVRTEADGRSYVYKQGSGGKLEKQYVTTGKSLWDYAIEIVSGLKKSDKIAFPYGDHVVEGAPTKEVDQLVEAYS